MTVTTTYPETIKEAALSLAPLDRIGTLERKLHAAASGGPPTSLKPPGKEDQAELAKRRGRVCNAVLAMAKAAGLDEGHLGFLVSLFSGAVSAAKAEAYMEENEVKRGLDLRAKILFYAVHAAQAPTSSAAAAYLHECGSALTRIMEQEADPPRVSGSARATVIGIMLGAAG